MIKGLISLHGGGKPFSVCILCHATSLLTVCIMSNGCVPVIKGLITL